MQISQNCIDIVYFIKYNIDKKGGKGNDGDYSTSLRSPDKSILILINGGYTDVQVSYVGIY